MATIGGMTDIEKLKEYIQYRAEQYFGVECSRIEGYGAVGRRDIQSKMFWLEIPYAKDRKVRKDFNTVSMEKFWGKEKPVETKSAIIEAFTPRQPALIEWVSRGGAASERWTMAFEIAQPTLALATVQQNDPEGLQAALARTKSK